MLLFKKSYAFSFQPLAMAWVVLFLLVAIAQSQARALPYDESDLDKLLCPPAIIDTINSDPDAGWTAGVNERFLNATLRDIVRMGSAVIPEDIDARIAPMSSENLEQIPNEFDSRTHWNCPSMNRILNQGVCGSCWAFSAIQVLQDRMCTFFGLDVSLSPEDVLSCCATCGNCRSGFPQFAFEYLARTGTVTSTCSPYFDTSSCGQQCQAADTPVCRKACVNSEDYSKKYHSGQPYFLRGIAQIQSDIMTKGPVVATLDVYEDFTCYKSGVYKRRQPTKFIIRHTVKLIGWGLTPEGTPYWLGTNQWSSVWGEGGHFKIAMGVNECNIEKYVVTAEPVNPQNHLVSVV